MGGNTVHQVDLVALHFRAKYPKDSSVVRETDTEGENFPEDDIFHGIELYHHDLNHIR